MSKSTHSHLLKISAQQLSPGLSSSFTFYIAMLILSLPAISHAQLDTMWTTPITMTDVYDLVETGDGGYAVCGRVAFGAYSDHYPAVAKYDEDGNFEWQLESCFPRENDNMFSSIAVANNSEIVVAGVIYVGSFGMYDTYIVKLTNDGDIVWERTAGISGGPQDRNALICQNVGGDFIIAANGEGLTNQIGYTIMDQDGEFHGGGHLLQPPLEEETAYSMLRSLSATPDGGFIIAADVNDPSSDTYPRPWFVCFNADLSLAWEYYDYFAEEEYVVEIRDITLNRSEGLTALLETGYPEQRTGELWMFDNDGNCIEVSTVADLRNPQKIICDRFDGFNLFGQSMTDWQNYIWRLDQYGQIQWTYYPGLSPSHYQQLIQSDNSGSLILKISEPPRLLKTTPERDYKLFEFSPAPVVLTEPGTSVTESLQIYNAGGYAVRIDSAISTDPVFSVPWELPMVISFADTVTQDFLFTPDTPGIFNGELYIWADTDSSLTYDPRLHIVSVIGESSPIPAAVEDLSISIGTDLSVTLAWSPVTETVHGNPVIPDYYLIFSNQHEPYTGDGYYFLGISETNDYQHLFAGQHADKGFYQVLAYVGSPARLDRVISNGGSILMEDFIDCLR